LTALLPNSTHGLCKHTTRVLAEAFCRKTNVSFAWGRIFYLYGPHEHRARLVPVVITSLLKGEATKLTSGEQVRDFLPVEQVAAAFVSLLASDVRGPVNVASGKPVSIKELVLEIAGKIGRTDLARFGDLPDRPGDPPVLFADVSRLREEVGWRPDPGDALDDAISWWREQLSIGVATQA